MCVALRFLYVIYLPCVVDGAAFKEELIKSLLFYVNDASVLVQIASLQVDLTHRNS